MIFAGLIELSLVAAVGFAVATVLGCAVLYPLVRSRLDRLPPPRRARCVLWWIAAPAVAGVALTMLTLAPSLLTAAGVLADHCAEHGHPHAHLCVLHPPASSGNDLLWLLVGAALVAGLGVAAATVRAIADGAALARSLHVASRADGERAIRVVSSDLPLSITAGLRRPTIFVSSALVRALPGPLLRAVIAHERAHVARRDPFRALIAATLGWLHLPWTRRRLLDDLGLASEEACDDLAARDVGSRVLVARAILAVERLLARPAFPMQVMALTGPNVAARIERLLRDDGAEHAGMRGGPLGVAVLMAAAMATLTPLHHLTETILQLVLGV